MSEVSFIFQAAVEAASMPPNILTRLLLTVMVLWLARPSQSADLEKNTYIVEDNGRIAHVDDSIEDITNIAMSHIKEGRLDEAEKAFEEAVRMKPTLQTLCNLGVVALRRGSLIDARDHILRALKIAVTIADRDFVKSNLELVERKMGLSRNEESQSGDPPKCSALFPAPRDFISRLHPRRLPMMPVAISDQENPPRSLLTATQLVKVHGDRKIQLRLSSEFAATGGPELRGGQTVSLKHAIAKIEQAKQGHREQPVVFAERQQSLVATALNMSGFVSNTTSRGRVADAVQVLQKTLMLKPVVSIGATGATTIHGLHAAICRPLHAFNPLPQSSHMCAPIMQGMVCLCTPTRKLGCYYYPVPSDGC